MGRKVAEKYFLRALDDLLPDGSNTKRYKALFASLSDKQMEAMVGRIEREETTMSYIIPNGGSVKVDVERLLKKDKDYGFNFTPLLKYSGMDVEDYTSPIPTLVLLEPVRRQIQTISKGVSVAENNKKTDSLTGQVSGDSASSKITMPEIQLLDAQRMPKVLTELLKQRGGDIGANNALNSALFKYGSVDQDFVNSHATGVVVLDTINNIFAAMHLKSNL